MGRELFVGRDRKARNLFQPKVTPNPFHCPQGIYLLDYLPDLNDASFSQEDLFWYSSVKIKCSNGDEVKYSKGGDAHWVYLNVYVPLRYDVIFYYMTMHNFPLRAPVPFPVPTCLVNHYSTSCSSLLCNVWPHALFTAHYSNPAMKTELFISLWALLGHWWQALANLFFTVPLWAVGVVLCLVYRWHLRQREIKFKSIHQSWFWTWCFCNCSPVQCCSFSKPSCLQI